MIVRVAVVFLVVLSSSAFADYFSPEYAAKITAQYLNGARTGQELIKSVAPALSIEEQTGLNDFIKEKHWANKPFPKAIATGAKVAFGKSVTIEFRSDRSFVINSRVYKYDSSVPLDVWVRRGLKGESTVGLVSLFLPEAEAMAVPEAGPLVLAGMVVAATITIGRNAVYLSSKAYELIKYYAGKVACVAGQFVVRSKGWASTTSKDIVAKSGSPQLIDADAAKAILQQPDAKCTSETAAQMQTAVGGNQPAPTGAADPGKDAGAPSAR